MTLLYTKKPRKEETKRFLFVPFNLRSFVLNFLITSTLQ